MGGKENPSEEGNDRMFYHDCVQGYLNSICLIHCVLVVTVMIYLFCEIFNWRGTLMSKAFLCILYFYRNCYVKINSIFSSAVQSSSLLYKPSLFPYLRTLNIYKFLCRCSIWRLLHCWFPQQTHHPQLALFVALPSLHSSVQFRRGEEPTWRQKEQCDLFLSQYSSTSKSAAAALMADQKAVGRPLTPQASEPDVLSSEKWEKSCRRRPLTAGSRAIFIKSYCVL